MSETAASTTTDHVFPTLTPAQINRIAPHGRRRGVAKGELLVEVGQRPIPFFVVLSGEMEVLRPVAGTEELIVTHASTAGAWRT